MTQKRGDLYVKIYKYSGVPEAYLNVTNPEYASGTPQARLRHASDIFSRYEYLQAYPASLHCMIFS